MSTAAKIAGEKREHPERFCRRCLWRVKHVHGPDTPCPKHPAPTERKAA